MRVMGMISGTSFDGVDVAVADLRFDGDRVALQRVGEISHPYPADLRDEIAAILPPNATDAQAFCQLDTRLGQLFADAAELALREVGEGRCDLIASHGQTIFHWVEQRRAHGTLQLGQPAWIAARTGVPVVADLRARDVAHGGHGAPLASTLDVLLLGRDAPEPRAALNLGGIANITVVGGGIPPIAFDTGPANALLDVAVGTMTGGAESFDRDGLRAARGVVDRDLLDAMLRDTYYALEPPKSTGKELFHLSYLEHHLGDRAIDDDVLATLVELTAATVADACHRFGVTSVVAAGGGVANPTLMRAIDRALGTATLTTIDELGLPSDAKEAYLFALLGFLTIHGLPGVVASCTGAQEASILGTLAPGADGFPSVTAPIDTFPTALTVEG